MKNIFTILDITGCVLHSLHSGKAPEQILLADGRITNPAAHAVDTFVKRYLTDILNFTAVGKIIAVNENGKNQYRKGVTESYKANRKPSSNLTELQQQALQQEAEIRHQAKAAVLNMLIYLGANVVELPDEEADDVIAYLVNKLPGQKFVYTVDGDLIALANSNTFIYQKGEPKTAYTAGELTIQPKYITLFKSLVGDTSDGYGGVKGFGPKKWEELVALHEAGIFSMDKLITIAENFTNLYDRTLNYETDIVSAKGRKELQELEEAAKSHKVLSLIISAAQLGTELDKDGNVILEPCDSGMKPKLTWGAWASGYQLAKIRPELIDEKVGDNFNRLKWTKRLPSQHKMVEALSKVGMGHLAKRFAKYFPTQTLVTTRNISQYPIEYLQHLFQESEYISLDWETYSDPNPNFNEAARGEFVDMVGSKITGAGITCGANHEHTFYFQFEHADTENNLPKSVLLDILGAIPDDKPIVAQNFYFELSVLRSEFGVYLEPMYDTKVMHCHIDEMESSGLKDLSLRYLGYKQTKYSDVIEKGKTMNDYTGQHVFHYGADDPLVTAHLFDLFYIILNLEGTWEFVRDNEFPTIQLLAESHVAGVSMDWAAIEQQAAEDAETVQRCTSKVRDLLRENVGNPYKAAQNWFDEEYRPMLNFYERNLSGQLSKLLKETGAEFLTPDEVKNHEYFKIFGKDLLKVAVTSYAYTPNQATELFSDICLDYEQSVLAELRGRYKYEDYVESTIDEEFALHVASKLDVLVRSVGINVERGKQPVEEYLVKLKAVSNHRLVHLLEPLLLETNSAKRKKLPEFEQVKAMWDALGNKKTLSSGFEMNLNSPKQMQDLMYGMLGLKLRVRDFNISDARKVKGLQGVPQANEGAIQEAIAWGDAVGWQVDVLENLLEAKKADTRIKLFYTKFPLWKHPKDGLIHPQFNSVGTESRRPSGGSPNMLQLSKKGDGVKVRRTILPNEKMGHDLVVALDFDGQELRIMAALSEDPNLLACYVGDDLKDVHSITAASIMKCSYDEFVANRKSSDKAVAKEYDNVRKLAKQVNFGSSYGIGYAKLARMLNIDEDKARESLEAKKSAYARFEEWKEEVQAEMGENGFVKTAYGSRKHIFNRLNNSELRNYYMRSSVNFLVQACAADYLKFVLATLWNRKTLQRHKSLLVAPIYDEIVVSTHSSQAVSLIKELSEVMQLGIPGLGVKMLTNPSVGRNFGDQIEVLEDCNQTLTDELIQIAIDKALGK